MVELFLQLIDLDRIGVKLLLKDFIIRAAFFQFLHKISELGVNFLPILTILECLHLQFLGKLIVFTSIQVQLFLEITYLLLGLVELLLKDHTIFLQCPYDAFLLLFLDGGSHLV